MIAADSPLTRGKQRIATGAIDRVYQYNDPRSAPPFLPTQRENSRIARDKADTTVGVVLVNLELPFSGSGAGAPVGCRAEPREANLSCF